MRLRRDSKVEMIGKVPLFGGCSKRELGAIAAVADEIDVPEGFTLIREGERGRDFVVIVKGTARVTQKTRKVRDLGPGDWAGEIALITDSPRTATVVMTSAGVLLVLTDRAFRSVLEHSPSIAPKLMRALGERLHATTL
jgi:CRP-like cAMP-binding protein